MRRSIRLPDYDYSRAGAYFVTLLAHRRLPLFGIVSGDCVRESTEGQVVRAVWESLPDRYPTVRLDAFVVMPDHVHALLLITEDSSAARSGDEARSRCGVRAIHESPLPQSPQEHRGQRRRMLLPLVVGYWKAGASRRINRLRDSPGAPVWHRNYYERIVRSARELGCVRRYIVDNPARWAMGRGSAA